MTGIPRTLLMPWTITLSAWLTAGAAGAAPPAERQDAYGDPLPPGAVARFGTVRLRHGDTVLGLQYTPDSRRLVSWGGDGVRVWDAVTGRQVRHFADRPPGPPLHAGALSPDSTTVAVTYPRPSDQPAGEGRVELWDVATGQRRHRAPTRHTARPAFAPDGRTLALVEPPDDLDAADRPRAVVLLDVPTGRERLRLDGHTGAVFQAVFSPDGRAVFSCGQDGTLRAWDPATGREVRQFAKPEKPVQLLAVSPDGHWLATYDWARPVEGWSEPPGSDLAPRLWDVATGREVRRLDHRGVQQLLFAPDGRRLLTGEGFSLKEWDVVTGRLLHPQKGSVPGLWAFAPDGRSLATAYGAVISPRDGATWEDRSPVKAAWGEPRLIAPSPDGRFVATARPFGRDVDVWEAESGRLVRRIEGVFMLLHVTWTADGRQLVTSSSPLDNKARRTGWLTTWDAATGRKLPPVGPPEQFGGRLLSPDGQRVVCLPWSPFGESLPPYVADRAAGRTACDLDPPGHPHGFTPDSRRLFGTTMAEEVCVWDADTGKGVSQFSAGDPKRLSAITFSRDGRRVAVGGPGAGVRVFDVASGAVVRRVEAPEQCWAVRLSDDGTRVAVGDEHGTVRVWDVAGGVLVREFAGHRGRITGLAFTADNKRLISGSADTTALVWDVSE